MVDNRPQVEYFIMEYNPPPPPPCGHVVSDNLLRTGSGREHFQVESMGLLFIYLFGVLRRLQHCTGHITMGSWKGRGNQYIQFVRVMYCKLLTNGKQLSAFPLEAVLGTEPASEVKTWV